MKNDNLPTITSYTEQQRIDFTRCIEAGDTIEKAALVIGIGPNSLQMLTDLLSNPAVVAAMQGAVSREIRTTGKLLAWRTAKNLMESAATPAATKWSAARWTLEASGEGIGVTRNHRNKPKELHEMTEQELTNYIKNARALVERTAIDVTPVVEEEVDCGGLLG